MSAVRHRAARLPQALPWLAALSLSAIGGCSALGLFDAPPAAACVRDDDCRLPGLVDDPCVEYACDLALRLCVGHLMDADDDGQGPIGCAQSAYAEGAMPTDCNDADSTVSAHGLELCGGVDNDCDGTIDEACVVPTLALGDSHSCYLAGPDLLCWGSNRSGQIGIGLPEPVGAHPRRVPIDGVASIVAGGDDTCAVRTDGHVLCWGDNTQQSLALESPSRLLSPTDIPALNGASSLTLSVGVGCAILHGEVVCWGDNTFGIFGASTPARSATPVVVPGLAGSVAVAASSSVACAIGADGTVSCWGVGLARGPTEGACTAPAPCRVGTLEDVALVRVGGSHACAVVGAGGLLACWGLGTSGQLGGGTAGGANSIAMPESPVDVTALGLGAAHSCAVSGGALWCWGTNRTGETGSMVLVEAITAPLRAHQDEGAFLSVAAGAHHTCGLLTSGDVRCWGEDREGQLGAPAMMEMPWAPLSPLATWRRDGQP